MRLLRVSVLIGISFLSAAAVQSQVVDTAAVAAVKTPIHEAPQELIGVVMPSMQDRLMTLGVSLVLSLGLGMILNEKRKRADRERAI